MARKIVDLPDGATLQQRLTAVENVSRYMSADWQKRLGTDAGFAKLLRGGVTAGDLLGELAADVATLANLVDELAGLHRLELGIARET